MLNRSWLRLGLLFLVGLLSVYALMAWGTSAAASGAVAPGPQATSPPKEVATFSDVNVDVPWEFLASQAAAAPSLNLGLHNDLVSGATLRPEPVVLVLLRDGQTIAQATAAPFPEAGGGYRYASTLYYSFGFGLAGGGGGAYEFVQAGDVLQASQVGVVVSLTVPVLTALADSSTDVVYGQAPAAAALDVYFYRYTDASVSFHESATTDESGHYAADLSAHTTMTARDYGFVFYADTAGNQVYRRYNAPFLQIGLGERYLQGVVVPRTSISVSLHDDAGLLRTWPYLYSDADGNFWLFANDTPDITLDAGQRVVVTSAGQVFSVTLPTLTASPDITAAWVTGQAPVNTPVQVDLYRGPRTDHYVYGPPSGQPDASQTITSGTTSGIYAAVFDDVLVGDYGAVYVTDPAGHRIYRRFNLPILRARLGDYMLDGQIDESGVLTVTVIGQSGLIRDVHTTYIADGGWFYDDNSQSEGSLRLSSGDRVSVSTESGQVMALTMPLLTAQVNLANNVVYGQAPPYSPLYVGFWPGDYAYSSNGSGLPSPGYSYQYVTTSTSAASGVYTADFSGLVTMTVGGQGAVIYTNSDGYEIVREYVVPYMEVQVGRKQVSGFVLGVGQIKATLRDVKGQVKGQTTDYVYTGGRFNVYFDGAVIEAGDTIEIVTYEETRLLEVPVLDMTTDYIADTIAVSGLPEVKLAVRCIGDGCGNQIWNVTTDVTGAHHLDLGGQVDIARGDQLQVTYTDLDSNRFVLVKQTPQLQVDLADNNILVCGPAYTAFTLTLRGADKTLLYTQAGEIGNYGGFSIKPVDPAEWRLIRLASDQTITANIAGDNLSLSLPHLTAEADAKNDTISGLAPAGAVLKVYVEDQTMYVTAALTGNFSLDLSGLVNIDLNTFGSVTWQDEEGNQVLTRFAGPFLNVTLGHSYISGLASGSTPITATLYDGSGAQKGSGIVETIHQSWFSVGLHDPQGDPVNVAGGDRLVIQSNQGETRFVVPQLRATFNLETQTLSGAAPAGGWLSVGLSGANRRIQVEANGAYMMDWADLAPRSGDSGMFKYVDAENNETTLWFEVPYYRVYLPAVVQGATS